MKTLAHDRSIGNIGLECDILGPEKVDAKNSIA